VAECSKLSDNTTIFVFGLPVQLHFFTLYEWLTCSHLLSAPVAFRSLIFHAWLSGEFGMFVSYLGRMASSVAKSCGVYRR